MSGTVHLLKPDSVVTSPANRDYLFTLEDYEELLDTGILEGETELIDGRIVHATHKDEHHHAILALIKNYLDHLAEESYTTFVNLKTDFDEHSQLTPDIIVFDGRCSTRLIIEIAPDDAKYEMIDKTAFYAKHNVACYLVVKPEEGLVIIHKAKDAKSGKYQDCQLFRIHDHEAIEVLPNCKVPFKQIFTQSIG